MNKIQNRQGKNSIPMARVSDEAYKQYLLTKQEYERLEGRSLSHREFMEIFWKGMKDLRKGFIQTKEQSE